ncbi:MAG: cytochrome b [Nevskia sp.]|nr:cytochrome b [Nevskia sp.]
MRDDDQLSRQYTRTAMALHWIVAGLIACGFVLGLIFADLPFSPQKLKLASYHKWIGMTVLLLAALRGIWRLTHAAPPLAPMPAWQAALARATHLLLYGLMLAVPMLGWLMTSAQGVPVVYLGVLKLPDLIGKDKLLGSFLAELHGGYAWLLFYVFLLHAAAALKHHFVDRDDTLRRMLRWSAR